MARRRTPGRKLPRGCTLAKKPKRQLDPLASRLIVCSNNKAHLFFNGLSCGRWCLIESSGVLSFADYAIVDTATGFSSEMIWARILAVPSPGAGTIPSLLRYLSAVEPSSRAKAAARKRRYKIAAVVIGIFVAFGIVLTSPDGFAYMYFFAMGISLL
jgi:DNA-binding helix-hairpin-helix protein with protein kinase domain